MREYVTERTALLDADYIAYQAAAWAHSDMASEIELVERVQDTAASWKRLACATHSIALFSCSREDNFRRDHYPLYKAHRSSDPPAMLEAAKDAIKAVVPSLSMPRLEADDIMGVLATNGKVENPVIVSRDKDMLQIPGWHLNPWKDDFPILVSPEDADRLFYQQWLTGDSVDGFGGIKGVGPKKAEKLLDTFEDAGLQWQGCLETYDTHGYTVVQALAQARCARILRAEDWDAEAKAVRPWGWEILAELEAGEEGQDE